MTSAPSSPSGAPLEELLAAWRAAEERLYPMVMVRPERYEQVVGLVGRTAVELQLSCPDIASLVAAAPGVAEVVRRLAGVDPPGPGPGLWGPADGLDLPLVAAAACAIRYRQLAAELIGAERAGRIASALSAGESWVVVDQGRPPTSWPPLPSTTVELHLPSGRALAETVEVDPGTGVRMFRLAEIGLDPVTGDPIVGEPTAPGKEYDSEELWRAAIAELRRLIEQDH